MGGDGLMQEDALSGVVVAPMVERPDKVDASVSD